jgi:hypothetical protein
MFTTTFQIRYIGLDLIDAGDVLKRFPESVFKDNLQAGWFEVLKESVTVGDIKSFRFHEWDRDLQVSKSIFYSDTAEQSRIFRHRLLNNQSFMFVTEFLQKKGQEITLDAGITTAVGAHQISLDTRFQDILYS